MQSWTWEKLKPLVEEAVRKKARCRETRRSQKWVDAEVVLLADIVGLDEIELVKAGGRSRIIPGDYYIRCGRFLQLAEAENVKLDG